MDESATYSLKYDLDTSIAILNGLLERLGIEKQEIIDNYTKATACLTFKQPSDTLDNQAQMKAMDILLSFIVVAKAWELGREKELKQALDTYSVDKSAGNKDVKS